MGNVMRRDYYNDNDPIACEWTTNLIHGARLQSGTVDPRPIQEVKAADVKWFTQCHFFNGIGGWPLALTLAGWPLDRPVWTGSAPCQPFSVAGKGKGFDDERHLWPIWRDLIEECRPPTIFGEQVASKLGREWLARVRADLEALGYVVGAADLCAASAGAPHIRQRLWWVAYTEGEQRHRCGNTRQGRREFTNASGLGDTNSSGSQRRNKRGDSPDKWSSRPASVVDFWAAHDLVSCSDGKARRIEPGTFPLAHGVPGRVGKLRAYGNALVPQVGAVFVRSFMEAKEGHYG